MQSLAYPIRRLQAYFRYFMNGSIDTGYWNSVVTYAKGDLVRDVSGVYESQSDGNLNNPITDTTFWFKVLGSFIGASERVKYNGRYLYLTWALNRWFGTTFLQPIYPAPYDFGLGGGTFSDIYITTDVPTFYSLVGFDELAPADSVYDMIVGYACFDDILVGTSSSYKFTIHMPLFIYNALGSTVAIRESVVRHFVDGVNVGGLGYSIVTY